MLFIDYRQSLLTLGPLSSLEGSWHADGNREHYSSLCQEQSRLVVLVSEILLVSHESLISLEALHTTIESESDVVRQLIRLLSRRTSVDSPVRHSILVLTFVPEPVV